MNQGKEMRLIASLLILLCLVGCEVNPDRAEEEQILKEAREATEATEEAHKSLKRALDSVKAMNEAAKSALEQQKRINAELDKFINTKIAKDAKGAKQ